MEFISVVEKVVSLFLIILIGVYGNKKGIINDEVSKSLRTLLLNITLPLLIINSFSFAFEDGMMKNIVIAFIYSIICFIISGVISFVFLKPLKGEKKTILHFGNIFSNCGFMGFPIIDSLYGAEGVVYTSIFNMIFSIVIWTYGVMLFSKDSENKEKVAKKDIKKVMLNPGIVAVYIGIPMLLFKIQLPVPIYDAFKIVGGMTTPISMLIVGNILATVKIKDIFKDFTIYYGTVIKMLIIPFVIYGISLVIKDNSNIMKTMILLEAMPAAAMTSIFAETYNRDRKYSAILIFITTLLSIITIPIISNVIG